ncbi:MAG: mechanosensitive ion channel domain-containing protein [Myxococcota bacterium]
MIRLELLFAFALGAIGLLILGAALYGLRRLMRRRRERLLNRTIGAAVDTELQGNLRRRGIESIQQQFTITRRAAVPLGLVVTVSLATIPLLDRIPAALLSLTVGVITVLIGVAARPFIENVIAGLVISISKVIRIGDTVKIDEWYGTIEDINTTHTTIKLWDWRRYVLPNSRMLAREFTNYSLHDNFVWACVEFWVDPGADLERVEQLAVKAMQSSTALQHHEEPRFWVLGFERDAVKCWVAGWADSPADAWSLRSDAGRALAASLHEAGIGTHRLQVSTDSIVPPVSPPVPSVVR